MTDIERDARALIDAFDGDAAFFAQNLLTGEEVGFRADSVMPTASTIKLLVLAEVIRQAEAGQFALDDPLPMISEDQSGGSGILKDLSPATLLTIRDHATLMIALSDNTSTMALVRLAGRARIEQAGQEWGMTATTLPIDRAPDGDARDYAASTPRDIVHLLQLIATDALVSPAASATVRDILVTQQYHDQIGRYLPYNQYQRVGAAHEGPIVVRSKSGFMTDSNGAVRVDAGIIEISGVQRYVLCLMTEHHPDMGFGPEHPGAILNGRISRLIFDAWGGTMDVP
ncbi:MAG TPA: class A beta-lactamase-related serine hydrolase [Thermomicrobiales bacterium]|nr:class A beta-lactamase-related serine hydrolase [Thermomicrobiales bacterium]HQZ89260.1 class A beta-lactamase-related serine hydrolase [Thermomicrobiales bacterium]HRA31585.1 class A beta-lactamase-related serine hydrolase [Thermomicrobiales bacterium]